MKPATDKNYWPYMLFSIPFAAVLFGILMITTALYFPDDVVVDNYYKEGMAINEQLTLDRRAKDLGLAANVLMYDEVTLAVTLDGIEDNYLQANVFHVTDKSLDRKLVLTRVGPGEYQVILPELSPLLAPGVWYLELLGESADWRLRGRVVTPVEAGWLKS